MVVEQWNSVYIKKKKNVYCCWRSFSRCGIKAFLYPSKIQNNIYCLIKHYSQPNLYFSARKKQNHRSLEKSFSQ